LIKGLKYGFKSLIGIEFVPSIAQEAKVNLLKIVESQEVDTSCEIICCDVRAFKYPNTNLALYLFNPFDPIVFEGFLSNLLTDLERNPRDLTLIYYHSHCENLLDNCDKLERVKYGIIPRIKLKILSGHKYGAWKYKL